MDNYIKLTDVYTFSEAATIWGLGKSTLRMLVHRGKLIEGKDFKKSEGTCLITKQKMLELYGEPKEV